MKGKEYMKMRIMPFVLLFFLGLALLMILM
jgi:hypothetical protein